MKQRAPERTLALAPPRAHTIAHANRLLRPAVLVLLVAASVLPFWVGRWLPFVDYPQHLGITAVLRHYADPAWDFRHYYTLALRPLPYWGFYLPAWLLSWLMPVELAGKVVLSLYAVALPLSLASLLGAFGRDRRLALFAVPLVWSFDLYMGFVTFLCAVPLMLWALAAFERWLTLTRANVALPAREAWRRGLTASALGIATYLAHGYVFLFYLIAATLLWLARRPRLRSMAPLVPALLCLSFWLSTSVGIPDARVMSLEHLRVAHILGRIGTMSWLPIRRDASLMAFYLYAIDAGPLTDVLFGLLAAVLLALIVLGLRDEDDEGSFFYRERLQLLCLGALFAYFVVPWRVGVFAVYVNARNLLFAALLAPAFAGRRPFAGRRRWLLAPLVALALAVPLANARLIHRFQATVGPLGRVLAAASPGGRTMGLIFDTGQGHPVRVWPLHHAAAYFQVLHGGDVAYSFAGMPSIPVRYRPGMQSPYPSGAHPRYFHWSVYGRFQDRIIVRGRAKGDARRLRDHAVRVVHAGRWTLYSLPPSIDPGRRY